MKVKKNSVITGWVKKKPLAAYFIFTFAITWSAIFYVPFFAYFGPTFSAIIVTSMLEGWSGIRRLIGRTFKWRVGLQWYLFVFFSTAVLGLVSIGLYITLFEKSHALTFSIIPLLLISGFREEYGWRGFALPRLLKKYNALTASIILGIIHATWHFTPISLINNTPKLLLFIIGVIPLTVFFTWIYNNTKGTMLLPILFHMILDVTIYILNITSVKSLFLIYISLNWILVIIIVLIYGPTNLSREKNKAEKCRDNS
jgi:membrane protease YdiL (CAAX protease family)